ncbi:TolC family protein [Acidobacteriota bacterium]
MLKRLGVFLLFFLPFFAGSAQDPLEQYVKEGLRNNLALQQKDFSLQKSLEALREAKGMFFPSVSIQARYSRAGGGRLILFPVGDLMNPVFASLNDLFNYHGEDAGFPTNLQNEKIPFLREREQETKIRLVQPIFQPAIYFNYKIKSSLSKMNMAQVSVFKRQLIADIKTAYYSYSKTLSVVALFEKTREVLEENLRISEKLVFNGKATEDVIFRAKAELADLDQKMAEAEKNKILAAMYFNFLVNRNLDEPISTFEKQVLPIPGTINFEKALQRALNHRNEFQQIQHAIEAVSHRVDLEKSTSFPSVLAVVDYGIQGEDYRFGKDDDYWMASLIFKLTLFNGNQNKARKTQALLDKKSFEVQKSELEKQIQLQVEEEYHALEAARKSVAAALEKEKSARASFIIVSKKFEHGAALQIEYLDARATYTNASINSIIAHYDFFIQDAQLERAAALSDLNKYND